MLNNVLIDDLDLLHDAGILGGGDVHGVGAGGQLGTDSHCVANLTLKNQHSIFGSKLPLAKPFK